MLVNITRIQAEQGNNVHIVVINDIFEETLVRQISPDVGLHRINRKIGSHNPWDIIKLNYCLHKLKPDVVHLHYSTISYYIVLPWLKSKMCNTVHSMCNSQNIRNIKRCGPIFAISEAVREDIARCTGKEAVTVTNGINPDLIVPRIYRAPSAGRFKIVQVARLIHEKKGQDILIEAVANLASKGCDVELTFIGEGPSLAELQDLAMKRGVSNIVKFLGNQSQAFVFEHLKDYDLYVHPSRIEGFGLTVAEAMSAQLPVLVSDNDGPMEIINQGQYGHFFKSGDIDGCTAKILALMRNYPSVDFLRDARNHIIDAYNIKNTATCYLRLYSRFILK